MIAPPQFASFFAKETDLSKGRVRRTRKLIDTEIKNKCHGDLSSENFSALPSHTPCCLQDGTWKKITHTPF